MKIARSLTVFCILFLTFAFTASSQKTKKPIPRPTPRATPISPDVTNAKQQVSNQLFNINVFVDKMGPVAVAMETADKEAADGKLKKEAVDANDANKKKMVAAIRGIRDGLVSLETDFRTKPSLAQYLPKIQGVSTLCAQSEDKAIAGQFVASKDPLRQVALKLNETLAVMPGTLRADSLPPPKIQNGTLPVSTSASSRTIPTSTQPNSTTRQEPALGMTAAEAAESSWGPPTAKRSSGTSNRITEVWMYPGNKSLYFFNGKLTNIVR
ncbi:MAG: hypothetical protein ACJ72Z_13295 [Pyrinomonadaceae bacterium]